MTRIHRPADGAVVRRCQLEIVVGVVGRTDPGTLRAELNGVPVALEASNPGGHRLKASLVGWPLARHNTLAVFEGRSGTPAAPARKPG